MRGARTALELEWKSREAPLQGGRNRGRKEGRMASKRDVLSSHFILLIRNRRRQTQ